VSVSGLRLYFYSTREGSSAGSRDIWVAERSAPGEAFGAPTPLVELNSASGEFLPRLSADERSILFTSQRPEGRGRTDIWQARRSSAAAPFGVPENVAELNTDADETGAWLSSDGLTIFLSSNRPGGQGRLDIWRATRTSVDQPFAPPEVVPVLSSPGEEVDLALSSNERELLLSSDRDGVPELWRSVRACR
jgi:Tol biopolymer transport system component